MEKAKLAVAEEHKFENGMKKRCSTSWKFRTVKSLIQATQIDNSSIRNLLPTRLRWMSTLVEQINFVVLGKYEFECRKRTKPKKFSLEVKYYQDTDAREKNNNFSSEYSSTSALFSIEILTEEIEILVAQKPKFDGRAKPK